MVSIFNDMLVRIPVISVHLIIKFEGAHEKTSNCLQICSIVVSLQTK